jgi:hypothetical protein
MRLPPHSKIYPNIPRYTYFRAKTVYTGSKGKMRFRIEPFDEIKFYAWFKEKCFDRLEEGDIEIEKTFEQSEQGYLDMMDFLEELYNTDERTHQSTWDGYIGWERSYSINFHMEECRKREKGIPV